MFPKTQFLILLGTFGIVLTVTAFAPLEKTLGANARIVYLHGAWVWAALGIFLAAAITGIAGLLLRRATLHTWSQATGRSGLLLWVTFLPMSLYVMQANWNGLFLDEPRFRIPLNFAIVGLLLQIGVSFFPVAWTSVANIIFAGVLFGGMQSIQTVLHPEAPILNAPAVDIRVFFITLLALLLLAGAQIANLWRMYTTHHAKK